MVQQRSLLKWLTYKLHFNFFGKSPDIGKASLWVLFLASFFRLVFLITIDSPFYFAKYPYFASQLSQGSDIGVRIIDLSPFYLYFLTAWHTCFGPSWSVLKVVQSILGVVNCWLIFRLGVRFFNPTVALIAGIMAASYGNLIALESTLEPVVFVLLFNLLAVYFLSGIKDHASSAAPTAKTVLMSGFFTGLSIITKPSFLLFLPVGCLVYLLLSRLSMARRLLCAALFVSASFVLILPISIRNYITLGDRVLVTADAGKVFFHGNGPGATALEWTFLDDGLIQETTGEPDYEHNIFRKAAEQVAGSPLLPSEASKFWFKRTLDHIIENPSAHLWLVAQKLAFFFTDYELHYIGAAYADYKNTAHWPFLHYGWIAGFGLVGMLLSAADWRRRAPIYGAFFVYLATCLIFIVQSRYRTPAAPYLCLFAAYAIASIFQRFNNRKAISAAMICLAASGLSIFSFTAFSEQIARIDRHQTAVQIHYLMEARPLFAKKDFKRAIAALDQSIRLEPDYAPSRLLRGKIYALYKQYNAAEIDFLKIIDMMPDSAFGYKNLGMLYLLEGQKEEALQMLQTANRLESSDETVLNALKRLKGERSEPVVWEIR